jgi:signal transduction histidine kinase/phage shock protein PspC (stress-responsive transcriptional regulator)
MDTKTLDLSPRRATRSSDDRYLGGVAAGLAAHLDLPVLWIRAAFLISAILGGFGVVLYAALWMVLPIQPSLDESSPGLEAATRQGRRARRAPRLEDLGPLVALAAVGIGVLLLAQGIVGGTLPFWPLVLGAVGLGVLWWQADEVQRERWTDHSSRVNPLRAILGKGGWAAIARVAVGAGLLVSAAAAFAVQSGNVAVLQEILVAVTLGVIGLGLIVGPWLFRLANDLSQERAARVRTEERADVAAHLHDSVLQTLALIQKHAEDGRTVASLARAQERDLRAWLYGDQAHAVTALAGALRAAAAEVEDGHGVPVEVVTVGDMPMSEEVLPLVLAAREAMVNSAKHSGAEKVDVYAEVSGDGLEVFVRDRGKGFDAEQVPEDRLGVRGSIVDRMQRHGGEAKIRTAPAEGTEVRLSMQTHARDRSEESS